MHLSEIWRKRLLHWKTMKSFDSVHFGFEYHASIWKFEGNTFWTARRWKLFDSVDWIWISCIYLKIWRKHLLNCKTMKIIWFSRLWIWISCIYLKFEGNTFCTVRRWKSFDSRDSGCKVNNVHTINRLFRPILQILNFVVLSDGYAKDFNQSLQQNGFI